MTRPRSACSPSGTFRPAVFCRTEGAPDGFLPPHLVSGLPPETDLLVGFSGGADSTLLLRLCVRYASYTGCRVFAAHLHHGIRGDEADRDEAFCRRTAADLGVPLFVGHADVPGLSEKSGESLEAEARRVRYDFFSAVMTGRMPPAPDFSCDYVPTPACPAPPETLPLLLTAHHADDQLETLLLRLLRGTGVDGLSGIPPVRRTDGGLIARPLLRCTKADILAACASLGLAYVTDSTNESGDSTRSLLRRSVLPALCGIAGDGTAEAAACRLADAAREDAACLAALAEERYASMKDKLSAGALSALPPALENRVLQLAWRDACLGSADSDAVLPPDRTLTAAHLSALRTLCERRVPHSTVSLPGGCRAVIGDAPACLLGIEPPSAPEPPPAPCALTPGDTRFGRYVIRVGTVRLPVPPEEPAPLYEGLFPLSAAALPLTVRVRASGDRILRHGVHQSLKKLYCDCRIPLASRASAPVICAGGDILWVPSVGFADGFPAPACGEALRIAVYAAD